MSKTNQETSSVKKFLILLEILGIVAIIFTAWTSHLQSQKQIMKMDKLINKYETQLDKAIAEDKDLGKRYAKNLRDALDGLSPKERKLLLSIYEVD